MKVRNIILGLVIVGAILMFVFPSIWEMIMAGIFGVSSLGAMATKQTIGKAKEQAGKVQGDVLQKDKEIAQAKDKLVNAVEEIQELGITIHGKLSDEKQSLEKEKQEIEESSMTTEEATDYIRSKLGKKGQ